MKYETLMKFDKHLITEEYVIDEKEYRAEFSISSLGFCTGMAGFSEYGLSIALYRKESKVPIGYLGIRFPMLQRSDVTNEEQMLMPCSIHWSEHPVPTFTPFAEREIERVVTEFVRSETAFGRLGFLLNKINVSVGTQDSQGRGREFPRGPVNGVSSISSMKE
ncbi:MAG: hypothetical protein RBR15_00475 [Sphaerochaeta sp.]|nr:hypothetical protein [Sphaerochaeta sp.]